MMQVGVGADGGIDGMGLQPSWSAGKGSDSGHRHQTATLSPLKKGNALVPRSRKRRIVRSLVGEGYTRGTNSTDDSFGRILSSEREERWRIDAVERTLDSGIAHRVEKKDRGRRGKASPCLNPRESL